MMWMAGLILGVLLLAALSRYAFRNARWIRPIFSVCVVVAGVLNGLGHTIATIFGQTVSTVRFARPARVSIRR